MATAIGIGINLPFGESSSAAITIPVDMWCDSYDAVNRGLVTESGGLVSAWLDLSGNANHLYQTNSSLQPLYINNSIIFSNDELNFTNNLNGVLNVIAVYNSTDASSIFVSNGSPFGLVAQDGSTSTTISAYAGTPTLYINGTQQTITNRQLIYDTANTGNNVIYHETGDTSAANWVGMGFGKYAAPYEFTGTIYEVICILGTLTLENRQMIEGYLAHRWDTILGNTQLVDGLPVSHPYKTTAPPPFFLA